MRQAGRRWAALLLLAGCAELQTPPAPPPPADLVQGAPDPARASVEASAAAFGDRGLGLAGKPEAAARAAAQLEFLAAELPRSPRFAPVPESVRRELTLARTELRDALGIAEAAPGDAVVRSLLTAARALRANDPAGAAAALPAPMFRPGGERSIARLGELGPLPQAANATALLAREVARLDAEGGWRGARPAEAGGTMITTFGLGGNQGLGY